jgi:hypothetical protein
VRKSGWKSALCVPPVAAIDAVRTVPDFRSTIDYAPAPCRQ